MTTPPWIRSFARAAPRPQVRPLWTSLLEDMTKDAGGQQASWRGAWGEVCSIPCTGASFPVALGCVTLLAWMLTPTWEFP